MYSWDGVFTFSPVIRKTRLGGPDLLSKWIKLRLTYFVCTLQVLLLNLGRIPLVRKIHLLD